MARATNKATAPDCPMCGAALIGPHFHYGEFVILSFAAARRLGLDPTLETTDAAPLETTARPAH